METNRRQSLERGLSMARRCEGVRGDGKTGPWTWHIGDPWDGEEEANT